VVSGEVDQLISQRTALMAAFTGLRDADPDGRGLPTLSPRERHRRVSANLDSSGTIDLHL
jgi:hypothetical protein